MTLHRFLPLLDNWEVECHVKAPIGSVGRNAQDSRFAKALSLAAAPLTRVPGLREAALHRLTFILRKPA